MCVCVCVCIPVYVYIYIYIYVYTGLFISPSGISELDCAITKTDTAKRSISIGREFFVLGALAYFQVPLLGGSCDEKWRSQWIRKRSVSWNLPKLTQLWLCNGGFGSCTTQNHLQTKQFVNGTWIPAEWLPVRCETNRQPLSHNWLSFGKFQDTERFLIRCERHYSSRLPPSGGTWKYAKARSTKKKNLREILYLLICSFLPCLSWLLRSRVRKSRRDLWITLYIADAQPDSSVKMRTVTEIA